MFNAYSSHGNQKAISHATEKKLIEKLLLLDQVQHDELRFPTAVFKKQEETQLNNFLNSNDILCNLETKGHIDFPGLTSKDQLIQKLNAAFDPPAKMDGRYRQGQLYWTNEDIRREGIDGRVNGLDIKIKM